MERSAKKEEYDIVVNDYARAKNLFGKTEVPVRIHINLISVIRNKYLLILHISFSDIS